MTDRLSAGTLALGATPADPQIHPLRRARRWGFYAAVRGLVGLVRAVPRPVATATLHGLARLARATRARDRAAVRRRVESAFGELGPERTRSMADGSWLRLASNLRDMARTDARIVVDPSTSERLEELRSRGPILALMAHLGAWELAAHALAEHAPPFGALTANPHNARIDAWLRAERAARGVHVFDRDREVAAATRFLRRGGTLAVLADHRPRGASVEVSWFGAEAPTTTGPGRMARIASATIVPVAVERAGAVHRLVLGESFEATGDVARDARRCNAALEALIRRRPEEWTWLHARHDES